MDMQQLVMLGWLCSSMALLAGVGLGYQRRVDEEIRAEEDRRAALREMRRRARQAR